MAKTKTSKDAAATRRGKQSPRKGAAPESARQTKKQIAVGRKQARQNRIIWLSVGILGLIILLVLLAGLVSEFVLAPASAVATVNGARIRVDTFQDLLQYRRYTTHMNIISLQNELIGLDQNQQGNDFLSSFYQQQLELLQSSLLTLDQDVLDELIDDALILEKANTEGVTVTDQDVQDALDEDLRQAAAPPQATITDTQTSLTPTAIPREQLDEIYQTALDSMGLGDKQFRTILKRSLLRTELQDALASQVVTTGLVIHVQLIETDTADQATAAQARIAGGEDFAVVATEVSTDTLTAANGGDVGWVTTGQLSLRYGEELENEAFALGVGQLETVESNGKYYVITVLERDENGPLPADVIAQRQNSALSDWLAERKAAPDVEIERLLEPDQVPPDPFESLFGQVSP